MYKKIILIILFSFLIGYSIKAFEFDPNLILTDEEILDSSSMTLLEIEEFLKEKGGYISKNMFLNASGQMKSAAQIIYEAANNYDCTGINLVTNNESEKIQKCVKTTINPKLLIVLLQKEQSLITDTSPTERQLNWALGYGCPDSGGCNSRWEGLGKQINSAALQFFDYVKNPHLYKYRAGNTYTVTNTDHEPSIITPRTNATAALYNYTPHVYYGNYNFFKLWLKFFTKAYPNGTLIQARGESGVWLIEKGKKRPFLTKGALTSRYDTKKIVVVSKSDLEKYPTGNPIKFPQYSLIKSPRGTIFLIVDDKRRGFASSEAFRKIGFNPEEIINASWQDINSYNEGLPITATSSYPTGALLQDKKTGGIYWVTEGTKAPLWSSVLLKTKYKGKSITQEDPQKLASYKTVEPAIFGDGELIKSDSRPAVYVIEDKKKRSFASGEIFEKLGYKWENIVSIPQKIVDLYEDGEILAEIYTSEDDELLVNNGETSTTTIENLNNGLNNNPSASTTDTTSSTSNPKLQDEINDILNP